MPTLNRAQEDLKAAILNYDEDGAKQAAEMVIESGTNVFETIQEVVSPTLKEIGEKFENNEIFLPHLMMAATATEGAVQILEGKLTADQKEQSYKGIIVLGTVHGDIHNIGKNIVGMMLKASGYKVLDLGVDVPVPKFVETAEKEIAESIAMSALMTLSMRGVGTMIEYLNTNKLRDKFKVIAGGGALSHQWAQDMGVDGYAEDALKTVKLVEKLLA